jgi:hypothetical protein
MSVVTQPFVDRPLCREEVVTIDVAAELRDDDVRVGIDERDGQRLRLRLLIVGTQPAPLGERRGGRRSLAVGDVDVDDVDPVLEGAGERNEVRQGGLALGAPVRVDAHDQWFVAQIRRDSTAQPAVTRRLPDTARSRGHHAGGDQNATGEQRAHDPIVHAKAILSVRTLPSRGRREPR